MALRQMEAEHAKLDRRIEAKPRDILADYTHYESEVCAILSLFFKFSST